MMWKVIVCWYAIMDILSVLIISVMLSVVITAKNVTRLNV